MSDAPDTKIPRAELVLFYEEYRQRVFRFCRVRLRDEHLAADAHQEVFFRMARYGQAFRDVQNKEAWLFEVARNCCLDLFRRSRTQSNVQSSLKDLLACDPPLVHEEPQRELRDQVRRLWTHPKVDEADRRIMKLLCESWTTAEVAEALGVSPQAINQRKRRLARLAQALENAHDDDASYVH
jgi:RNA polymerase sigma factor (sigma-70 family)